MATASTRSARRRPWTRFWRISGGALTLVLLPLGAVQTVQQLAHEEYTQMATYDATDIDVIEVRNLAGRVQVSGTAQDTVTVTALISDGLQDTRHNQEVEDGRLVLTASCPWLTSFCNTTYAVETPPDVALIVRSDARVEVAGISGQVEVVAGGGVEADDLSGTVSLRSRDSSVEASGLTASTVEVEAGDDARLRFTDTPDDLTVRSHWGSADIVVPDAGTYAIDATSSYGSVDTTAMRIDPASERVIEVRTGSDLIVRYDD